MLDKIFQFLYEWHCILEGHIWYTIPFGKYGGKIKCARCGKIKRSIE